MKTIVTEIKYPEDCKYISSKTYDPIVIKIRKQMAESYRLMRKDNVRLARLVYKTNKGIEIELNKMVLNSLGL